MISISLNNDTSSKCHKNIKHVPNNDVFRKMS